MRAAEELSIIQGQKEELWLMRPKEKQKGNSSGKTIICMYTYLLCSLHMHIGIPWLYERRSKFTKTEMEERWRSVICLYDRGEWQWWQFYCSAAPSLLAFKELVIQIFALSMYSNKINIHTKINKGISFLTEVNKMKLDSRRASTQMNVLQHPRVVSTPSTLNKPLENYIVWAVSRTFSRPCSTPPPTLSQDDSDSTIDHTPPLATSQRRPRRMGIEDIDISDIAL